MENRDVTLLAIVYAQDKGLSPIQIQKSLFLIGQSGHLSLPRDFYKFVPYNYGPFNPDVYRDVDRLIEDGLVEATIIRGQRWSKHIATTTGIKRASKLKRVLKSELCSYVEDVVNWVLSLSFSQLLRAIYTAYPEFRRNSVFQS